MTPSKVRRKTETGHGTSPFQLWRVKGGRREKVLVLGAKENGAGKLPREPEGGKVHGLCLSERKGKESGENSSFQIGERPQTQSWKTEGKRRKRSVPNRSYIRRLGRGTRSLISSTHEA